MRLSGLKHDLRTSKRNDKCKIISFGKGITRLMLYAGACLEIDL